MSLWPFSSWKILVSAKTPYIFLKIYIKLIGWGVSLIAKIAASPSQSSSTLIFGFPVVPWVSCCHLDVTIWTYLFQGDF